jgi:hypothetical protein
MAKIERVAKSKGISVEIYCDPSHAIHSKYSKVRIVDAGLDSVDFAILSNVRKGDVVVTNDGGLAALVLAKRGFAVSAHGRCYTNEMIDDVLNERYFIAKALKSGKRINRRSIKFNKPSYHYDFINSLTNIIEKQAFLKTA